MNRKELSQNHWKYYLMLEKRFVESIEFVELHEDNFDAFSNGYALLIQAIGAELDTVFKEFCGFNTTDRKTVADYAQYILTNTPDIKNQKISVQEYDSCKSFNSFPSTSTTINFAHLIHTQFTESIV